MELGPNQTQWLQALRSGLYDQGRYALNRTNAFCCLGVACEIFDVKKTISHGTTTVAYGRYLDECGAPIETIDLLQLYGSAGESHAYYDDGETDNHRSLANLNDNGRSFLEIADTIEANPASYFRSPK